MTPTEFQAWFSYLGNVGLGIVIGLGIAFLFLKSFVPAYLAEKGKNLATQEDIAKITEEIEKIKHQFDIAIEERKGTHQLRLAAIDKRLAAHQQAFTLWREVLANTNAEEISGTAMKCQKWWEANCLYLEPSVRTAFVQAYMAAANHRAILESRPAAEVVKGNFDSIIRLGDIILHAAQLPGLTEEERKIVEGVGRASGTSSALGVGRSV